MAVFSADVLTLNLTNMDIKISVPQARSKIVMPKGFPPHLSVIWEKYPRIGEKITLMWGYVELQEYLGTLIFDERGGRDGFAKPVLAALVEIQRRHAQVLEDNK